MLAKPSERASCDQVARRFERLNAVDGLLHFGMKVLDAEAQTVEAHAGERFEMRARGDAWVHLDADFRVGCEGEAFARPAE